MKPFSIASRQAGAITVLDVRGSVTMGESSKELRRALEEVASSGSKYVLLDLAEISYLDSSGLGSLLVGHNSLKSGGGSIGLLRAPVHILELLELSRLTSVFRLFDSEEEATRQFSAS